MFNKINTFIIFIVALIATNLSAFEPFTLSFTDRAADNKPNVSANINVRLTLVNRYTGADIGTPASYVHTATAVKTNAYGMFSVVFEPETWKNASFTGDFENGYNNYALRIETKAHTGATSYKQIGVLAIGNLINNTVATEAISGPAKSNFKITINEGKSFSIPNLEGGNVPFAVEGFTPETIVKSIPCEGYSISITAYDKTTGKGTANITAIAGASNEKPELILFADNGNGRTKLASQDFIVAYYGPASGLVAPAPEYETNRAKLVWIITDADTIPKKNDIKTALDFLYNANDKARRQLVLPNATSIGFTALASYALTSVSLPKATSIGGYAFYSCINLVSVSFPLVTTIGQSAFERCRELTSISLLNVTSIENRAFGDCTKLASVSLPNATNIGEQAFDCCYGLTSVSLPKATTIGANAFNDCKLSSISLPLVTTLGANAFSICTSLSSVSLPLVTTIEHGTFRDCHSLSSLDIPNVTSIGTYAFLRCSGLPSISLPYVISIGDAAFEGCNSLTSVSFRTEITIWGTNVFSGATNTSNIALTFKDGQKTFIGADYNSWSITGTDLIASPMNNQFVGKTFKEIKLVP